MSGDCQPARACRPAGGGACRPATAFATGEFWYGFVVAVVLILLARALRLW